MRTQIADDPRFVLIVNDERLGFYGNFERVLGLVPLEAEYVALADQDDRWDADKLETLLTSLGERDLVYSDMRIVDERGSLLTDTYWTLRRTNYTDLASLLVGNTVTGAASLFRGELLERALPFPPRRGRAYHDHWLALVAITGRGIAYVERPLQDYVQHGDAAQGHAEANAGAEHLRLGVIAGLAPKGLLALAGRGRPSGWAQRYFGMYTRTVAWSRVLLMRSSGSLSRSQRRMLERIAASERSPLTLAWLAGRSLRPIWGANEAFGRELLVLSSALWGRALAARSRWLAPRAR